MRSNAVTGPMKTSYGVSLLFLPTPVRLQECDHNIMSFQMAPLRFAWRTRNAWRQAADISKRQQPVCLKPPTASVRHSPATLHLLQLWGVTMSPFWFAAGGFWPPGSPCSPACSIRPLDWERQGTAAAAAAPVICKLDRPARFEKEKENKYTKDGLWWKSGWYDRAQVLRKLDQGNGINVAGQHRHGCAFASRIQCIGQGYGACVLQ